MAPPRYSDRPLPPYRFVPGRSPHPHRDPDGYARGEPPPEIPDWEVDDWETIGWWLHAVDLFNHRYWWACHEVLEGMWQAAGRTTPRARFVQGLLQVAAAHLNHRRGHRDAARSQAERGLEKMEGAFERPVVMGIDLGEFARMTRRALSRPDVPPATIALRFGGDD